MTTIHLGRPENNRGQWVVFGNYEGQDDRYTFGFRKFAASEGAKAEAAAHRMMETFRADHFERM